MEIKITGDPVIDNLKNHRELVGAKIRDLAYERLRATRQIEDIDKVLAELEGAQQANEMVQKDIDLRETIAQAQKEKAVEQKS
jgi:hypothetical protein